MAAHSSSSGTENSPGMSEPDRVGVFGGPWDTGWAARDGAVLGFEDVFRTFSAAAQAGEIELITTDFDIFRSQRGIADFLQSCDVVYANCGPWAALLHLVREREQLDARIIREIRTIGWIGYIWQEDVAGRLERPGDQRVFPSRYARDIWDAALPGLAPARVYYPMIEPGGAPAGVTNTYAAGFFSVLSRDKGFNSLPGVIGRLHESGHRIDRLLLAGQLADPDLYRSVVDNLSAIGVDVDYRGGMPNRNVVELMAECDVVLFLTTSSIESLGRVMVEASAQRVPVVAADFGAARDLVAVDYRIPVDYCHHATGLCDSSFALGELAPERWKPPAALVADDCYLQPVSEYRADAQPVPDVLTTPSVPTPAEPPPLAFSFTSEVDGLEVAQRLLDAPKPTRTSPYCALVDLGGTLKQYLLAEGYNPRVSFRPT